MAINLAKLYTENTHIICLENAYHGMVGNSYHVTSMSTWKNRILPMPGLERTKLPDMYRGIYAHLPEKEAALKYVEELQRVIDYNTNG